MMMLFPSLDDLGGALRSAACRHVLMLLAIGHILDCGVLVLMILFQVRCQVASQDNLVNSAVSLGGP